MVVNYYKDVPVPKPKDHEILIKVHYSGVCHSDLHAWKGDWPAPTTLPLIGGHEGIGQVVALGKDVTDFQIGDFAGIKWLNHACMDCETCNNNLEQLCDKQTTSGYSTNGTFRQYATVDFRQAAHIPKDANHAELSPILCGGLTSYSGIKNLNLKPGQWITIVGAGGGLGSLGLQYAKQAFKLKVLGIDQGDKFDFVKSLGADAYIDYTKESNVAEKVKEITNGGSHGVLNVSGSQTAINQSFIYARKMGKVALIAVPPNENGTFTYSIAAAIAKQLTITGSCVGNRENTQEALDYVLQGKVKSPIKIASLKDIPEIFKLLEEGRIKGRYVVDLTKLD
ncbi:unnamed protein product [Candida verbasci]|uniref:alcohol dehydrogenase n=1 Tax=Candida verbasci TaxID=1227364 RepID=A0A9W4X9M9_9ASCO|nr:unnamed protein product [Candida verbasci]